MEYIKQVIFRLRSDKSVVNDVSHNEKNMFNAKVLNKSETMNKHLDSSSQIVLESEEIKPRVNNMKTEEKVGETNCVMNQKNKTESNFKTKDTLENRQLKELDDFVKDNTGDKIDPGSDLENNNSKSFISDTCLKNNNKFKIENVTVIDELKEINDKPKDVNIKTSAIKTGVTHFEEENDIRPALYERFNMVIEENDDAHSPSVVKIDNPEDISKDIIIIDEYDVDRSINNNNSIKDNVFSTELKPNSEIENSCVDQTPTVSAENLISNITPQEWLNLDEFENIVKELKSDDSTDIFDIEEELEMHIVEKKFVTNGKNTNKQSLIDRENVNVETNSDNKLKADIKKKTTETDVIFISSDEENDLKLDVSLDELDTISLSSKEILEDLNICAEITNVEDCEIDTSQNIADPKDITECAKEETPLKDIGENYMNGREIQSKEVKNTIGDTFAQKVNSISSQNRIEVIEISIESPTKYNNVISNGLKENEMDAISLVSNSSFCSDYHSSDFEFITEDEAKTDGVIINYYKKTSKHFDKDKENSKTIDVTSDSGFHCSGSSQNSDTFNSFDIPGPSQQNVVHANYHNIVVDYNYRQNHDLPQGEQYFNLFEGYAPTTPYMYENKSMHSVINEQYQGIGFDVRLLPQGANDVDAEYQKEADESAKKILNMYPGENRKRRRRF